MLPTPLRLVLLGLVGAASAGPARRAGLPLAADGRPAASALGLNIHNPTPTEATLEAMGEAGLGWLRGFGVAWPALEPKPGQYNFSQYAAIIERLGAHGHRIVTGPSGFPSFYEASWHAPATQAAFGRLMAALAARFEGHQVLWELTNEPNLNGWAGWDAAHAHRGNASGMGWFFRDVCGAMHKASPASLCVGPSTGFIGPGYKTLAWTQEFFETGALEEIDALLVHPYRCDGPETAIADMRALRTLAAEYTPVGREIPLYQGEWGYSSGAGATPLITVEQHAKLVARIFLVSMLVSDPMSILYTWQVWPQDLAHAEIFACVHPSSWN